MKHIHVRSRAVIADQGELLVVRNKGFDGVPKDFLALPGGGLEHGEDPEECMARELQEELGIVPELGRLLYVYTYQDADERQSIEFFFEVKNTAVYREYESHERSHDFEIEECLWISPKDTEQLLPKAFAAEFREGRVFDERTRFLRG